MQKAERRRLILLAGLCAFAFLCFFLLGSSFGDRLYSLLAATAWEGATLPRAFGAFHIVSLLLCVGITVAACILAWRLPTDGREAIIDRVVYAFGVLFFFLELYKQLFSYFVLRDGQFNLSILPFQFCSLPLYLCLLAPLLPWRRIKRWIYCFLAIYGTVGGYLVMGYPSYAATLSLCIHSTIWHTAMIALGGFLLIGVECGGSWKEDYLPPSLFFLAGVSVAMLLNELLHPLAEARGDTLNLFYISPYFESHYFLISDVQKALGWFPSVVTYVLLFVGLGAFPLWLLGRFFMQRRKKNGKK